MEKIIVRATFHAAHRQVGYPGACQFVHGHTWRGKIVVSTPDAFPRDALGMSIDFGALKAILRQFDHKLITTREDPAVGEGVVVIDDRGGPSVENVAAHVADEVEAVIRRTFAGRWRSDCDVTVTIAETRNNRFVVGRKVQF